MMRMMGAAGLAALGLLVAGTAAPAQAPVALAPLETGLWELRDLETSAPPARLCISNLLQLLQPVQPEPLCRHFIAENEGSRATVAYDCAARGRGRTSLRVETPRLLQIDSQGVADGRPFDMRYEARRLGACKTASR